MNIKEHIEAGHYPVDDKGRALVQASCGQVTIVSTDRPGPLPILGWTDGGDLFASNGEGIRPPPPHIRTRYAAVHRGAMCDLHWHESDGPARRAVAGAANGNEWALLTMEYEEPWS